MVLQNQIFNAYIIPIILGQYLQIQNVYVSISDLGQIVVAVSPSPLRRKTISPSPFRHETTSPLKKN